MSQTKVNFEQKKKYTLEKKNAKQYRCLYDHYVNFTLIFKFNKTFYKNNFFHKFIIFTEEKLSNLFVLLKSEW